MSEAQEEKKEARQPWVVQFELAYNENGPATRWGQNREPDLFELALFQNALVTKLFRGGALFSAIEDRAAQTETPAIVTPNGGHPPALTTLGAPNAQATPS